ncbi:S8 family serine peptidase [Streptomyces sp. NPDC005549]|uniref:S8 family serine peptidase n=1 Tax=Streptomyces sp. NPDC005549 TaxID=3154888 RepID=UPI0033A26976
MRQPRFPTVPLSTPGRRRRTRRWSQAVGALAVTAVCAVGLPAQAAAADGGTTSLPAMPLALARDAPCTPESKRTAEGVTWAQKSLSLPHAWKLSRGQGVTVAVVGSGVSLAAPALEGRVTTVGDAGEDCVGHGTFIAGLIAAARTDGTAFQGVAPAARVLGVRGTDERGIPSAERVATGIRAAVDRGARVVSVASALPTGKKELTDAVRHAVEHDVLVVAPVAPDAEPRPGDRTAEAYWPAAAPGVLSVVGVGEDGAALKSAVGSAAAELAAPGGPVIGVGPRGEGHFIAAGSSAAAAYTAGAAALVRAYDPDLTAAETADRLTLSAAPAGEAARLDPYAALSMVSAASRAPAAAPVESEPLRLPVASTVLQDRALVIAGAMAMLVILVAAAAAVIPRGRARGWRRP